MKTSLNKVKKRINIKDYSIKELLEYFEQFDNYICVIKTEKNIKSIKTH